MEKECNMAAPITNNYGLTGYLHDIEYKSDSLLIFQLSRPTNQLSETYMTAAKASLKGHIPEGREAILIGCDVNVYELAGPDAVVLKLKGLI